MSYEYVLLYVLISVVVFYVLFLDMVIVDWSDAGTHWGYDKIDIVFGVFVVLLVWPVVVAVRLWVFFSFAGRKS